MRYDVVVGNIGTVYTGTELSVALEEFHRYKALSCITTGRVSGEPVVVMEDGEPMTDYDHQGCRWFFENHSTEEAAKLLSERRREHPTKCPVCHEHCTEPANKGKEQDYDEEAGTLKTKLLTQCRHCGFVFKDVLTTEGIEVV